MATAATARPRIISRAAWGANESIRRANPDYSDTVKAAFVHHTVQSNSYSPSESAALIRSDYLYHVRTRGWNDIGYNFLVDRYGRVFEGRYGGVTRAVLGAHAGGFNTNSTGVALLGTFTSARPTAPMLAALHRLLAWKLDLTHVDPRGHTVLRSAGGANTRYPAGRRVVVNTILGHRSTSYTTCPGSPTIARLRTIRAAVSGIGRPKIYGGSATTSRVRPEHGGYAGVHARFSSTVRWRVAVTGVERGHGGAPFSGTGSRRPRSAGTAAPAAAPWPRPGWTTKGDRGRRGCHRPAGDPAGCSSTGPPAPGGQQHRRVAPGAWRVNNANAEQLSASAGVFASYGWGTVGRHPGGGDGTATAPRPSASSGPTPTSTTTTSCCATPTAACSTSGTAATATRSWSATGTATAPSPRPPSGPASGPCATATPAARPTPPSRSGAPATATWPATGTATATSPRACTGPAPSGCATAAAAGPPNPPRPLRPTGDLGFAGDWNGNGTWTLGLLRAGTRWYLRNSFSGAAGVGLAKQHPGTPVVGDWDNRP